MTRTLRVAWGRRGVLAPLVVVAAVAGCGSTSPSTGSSAAAATSPSTGAAGTPTPGSTGSGGQSWFVSGTVRGATFQGPVTVARVLCTPISVGGSSGVQVTWGGTVHDNAGGRSEQISGDMSFPQFGDWTIPTNDPHTPVASLVVAGDYSNRYGLSSGTGGLGSGSLTAAAGSGTVDATYSTGSDMLMLKGSWTCS